MSETVPAGRAVVDVLRAEGVRCVFGLPGGHTLAIYDALYDRPEVRHVLVRHEQHAASMAAAYAQLTGEVGVCMATAGPGVTNLLTGIAEGHVGSLPIVVIGGRASIAGARRGEHQFAETDRVFAPVTKWSVCVERADLIVPTLRQAFATARGGRPGPVYVDIPRDLLDSEVPALPYLPVGAPARPAGEPARIEAAAAALAGARLPIIVAGGGTVMSDAFAELRELAELLAAPVLTSLSGRGSLPDDHPLAAGGLGAHRNPLSARLLVEADVVLGLGTRFEGMESNWRPGFVPAPDATYIQVDIEAAEIGRAIPARIGIVGDVREVVRQLLPALRSLGASAGPLAAHPRVREIAEEVAGIDAEVDRLAASEEKPVNPVRVLHAVRAALPREAVVAVDVGCITQHIAGGFPFFRTFEPRSMIVPSSFYGMGFVAGGLPAARVVHPGRPAVCFVGDGSFQMVMNVLPAAAEERLPVTWCVMNDAALGSIWDIQEHRFQQRILATAFEVQPDFAAVARACGCHGERVEDPADVEGAIARALAANEGGQPAVLDFIVGRERMLQSLEYFGFYPAELVEQARYGAPAGVR